MHQSFLDIKGAYDSVDRSLLWPKCENMDRDGDLIRLLKSPPDHVKVMVRVGRRQSREATWGWGYCRDQSRHPSSSMST